MDKHARDGKSRLSPDFFSCLTELSSILFPRLLEQKSIIYVTNDLILVQKRKYCSSQILFLRGGCTGEWVFPKLPICQVITREVKLVKSEKEEGR